MNLYFKNILLSIIALFTVITIYKLYDFHKKFNYLEASINSILSSQSDITNQINNIQYINKSESPNNINEKKKSENNNLDKSTPKNKINKISNLNNSKNKIKTEDVLKTEHEIKLLRRDISNIEQLISESDSNESNILYEKHSELSLDNLNQENLLGENSEFDDLANINLEKNSEFNDLIENNIVEENNKKSNSISQYTEITESEHNLNNLEKIEIEDKILSDKLSKNEDYNIEQIIDNLSDNGDIVSLNSKEKIIDTSHDGNIQNLSVPPNEITLDIITNNLSKKYLENLCLDNKLSKSGNKAILAQRLIDNNYNFSENLNKNISIN